jgi:hypothetical protein
MPSSLPSELLTPSWPPYSSYPSLPWLGCAGGGERDRSGYGQSKDMTVCSQEMYYRRKVVENFRLVGFVSQKKITAQYKVRSTTINRCSIAELMQNMGLSSYTRIC